MKYTPKIAYKLMNDVCQELMDKFEVHLNENGCTKACNLFLPLFKANGWTFEYGLDGIPFAFQVKANDFESLQVLVNSTKTDEVKANSEALKKFKDGIKDTLPLASKEVSDEINTWLEVYGRKDAIEPQHWNSPDANNMEMAAEYLSYEVWQANPNVKPLLFPMSYLHGGFKANGEKSFENIIKKLVFFNDNWELFYKLTR